MAFIIWCLLSGHVDFIVLILLIFAALLTCVLCRFFLLMIIKSANETSELGRNTEKNNKE